jgi:hypothetical protein
MIYLFCFPTLLAVFVIDFMFPWLFAESAYPLVWTSILPQICETLNNLARAFCCWHVFLVLFGSYYLLDAFPCRSAQHVFQLFMNWSWDGWGTNEQEKNEVHLWLQLEQILAWHKQYQWHSKILYFFPEWSQLEYQLVVRSIVQLYGLICIEKPLGPFLALVFH